MKEEKEDNEEVEPIKQWEKAKPKKTPKNKKKIAIIIIVILLIIAVAGTGAFFYYQHKKETRSVGTTWGDTYFAYLKEAKQQKDFGEMEKYGLEPNMENTQLQFCQIEENEEPMMLMTYKKEDKSYVNAYHIGDDGKVVNVAYKEPSKVELLYNISLKQYIWYIHIEKNNEDLYKPLTTAKEEIEENKDTNTVAENATKNENDDKEESTTSKKDEDIKEEELTAEITIEKDETTSVETVDGDVLSIPKFDETFVKPEIQESQKTDIDFNKVDESELKDLVETTVQGYKPNEQIVTEEVKETVNEKVEQVEEKQEEMKEAEEEVKEKELEEAMKVTNENIQSKLGEHLKWFGAAYLGSTYGWETVYEYKEVNVKIPGEHPDAMVYELVGAKSKANMESKLAQYVSRSKFSKFKERADFMGDLKEYKGKVYWTNLGIGGGPYMKTNQAKVISSEDGITKVKLEEYSSLGEVLSAVITITFKYDEDTSKYLITDWSTKDMY